MQKRSIGYFHGVLRARVSEGRAPLASALSEGLDASVVAVAAAVEHDALDAGRLRTLGERLAGLLGLLHRLQRAQLGLGPVDGREGAARASSMSWAKMPRLERNTDRRGRSAVPRTFARTRRRRLRRLAAW